MLRNTPGQALGVAPVAGPALADRVRIAGQSPVADRVMAMALGGVVFSACADTMAAIGKRMGTRPVLPEEAHVLASRVVRLVELQREGWAYIWP